MASIIIQKLKRLMRAVFAISATAVLTSILLWGINDLTGVFTYMHLEHEDNIVEQSKDPELVQSMIEELTEDSKSVFMWKRRVAANELSKLGELSGQVRPVLEVLLKDKDYEVRQAAKKALDRIKDSGNVIDSKDSYK